MRSELAFGAMTYVSNRFLLTGVAAKATRKFHRPNTRIQDTANECLDDSGTPIRWQSCLASATWSRSPILRKLNPIHSMNSWSNPWLETKEVKYAAANASSR
jgi:hypothetical protein